MKKILVTLFLMYTGAAQAAPALEPVNEIPNTFNTLDWTKYSTKEIKAVTAYAERMLAEEKQAKLDSVCKNLDEVAFDLCKQAQAIELTEVSAVKPVQAWLVAALSVEGDSQDRLLKVAAEVASERMSQDAFVSMIGQICEKLTCAK